MASSVHCKRKHSSVCLLEVLSPPFRTRAFVLPANAKNNRAWELLVNAQRESRDADIFRRVVDRIKVCVEEATAPATAAAAATAAPDGSTGASRPGSPTQLPPVAPADPGNKKKKKMRKKEKGSGAGAVDGPAGVGASEAQCNWALAHAACRVCRVVGRTFQVAIRCVLVRRQASRGTVVEIVLSRKTHLDGSIDLL